MKISKHGVDLIKSHEGWSGNPYIDLAGKVTIGYGHKVLTRDVFTYPHISPQFGELVLEADIEKTEKQLQPLLKDIQIHQAQYDAIVSLCYNVGVGAFKESKMYKKLAEGDIKGAASEFDDWVHVNGEVIEGLVRRRRMEKELFTNNGTYRYS